MYKKIVFLALLFTGLAGCQSNSKSAFSYSEAIVAKEESLTVDIQATESKVEKFALAKQFDSIAAAGAHMEGLVQKKIDEINAIPVPHAKEADNFQAATLRYFKYIKSLYTGYKNWGNAATEEERQQVVGVLQKIVDGKQSSISDMQRAQKKYADANGFQVR